MYLISPDDAMFSSRRIHMPEFCLFSGAGAFIEGRVASAVTFDVATLASIKSVRSGVRAWSPPV